ncbi:unnamed protein product [Spirodela intermedia]|uniref:Uncharacterized protein n=1 Tax=Spirodela intermedia TaxID=51605 RepID=A0A7I8KBY1_SPIIN|nr:unnamed protein product [Spirodela intermedia]
MGSNLRGTPTSVPHGLFVQPSPGCHVAQWGIGLDHALNHDWLVRFELTQDPPGGCP